MTRPGAWRMLARGLTRRCPRCGRGGLFRRWLVLTPRCPRCDLPFEREDGAFLGSLSLNYGVTGIVFLGYLIVWIAGREPGSSPVVPALVSVGIVTLVPLLVYPFAKTTWAAIDLLLHRMDARDPEP